MTEQRDMRTVYALMAQGLGKQKRLQEYQNTTEVEP